MAFCVNLSGTLPEAANAVATTMCSDLRKRRDNAEVLVIVFTMDDGGVTLTSFKQS